MKRPVRKTHTMLLLEYRYGRPIEHVLEHMYCDERRSQKSIAEEMGVHVSTISKWLKRFRISRDGRSFSEKNDPVRKLFPGSSNGTDAHISNTVGDVFSIFSFQPYDYLHDVDMFQVRRQRDTATFNPATGHYHGEFTWCRVCQRVYLTKTWLTNGWFCPTKECTGLAVDSHNWSEYDWPRSIRRDFPAIPQCGMRYTVQLPWSEKKS